MRLVHSPNIKPAITRQLTPKELKHQKAVELASWLKKPSELTVEYILDFEEKERFAKASKRKKLATIIEVPVQDRRCSKPIESLVGIADEILKYKKLLIAEAITDSEFQAFKDKLLAL